MSFFGGTRHYPRRAFAPVILCVMACGIMLGGCSINLGSLSSDADTTAPKAAPDGANVRDAQSATSHGQALLHSGNIQDALAEFDRAITLDPHNADALYNRGLIYQGQKQHELAVDDFTAANGLTPQRADPLLARANSYLALDKVNEAAADLDEAAQSDPQNAQIWMSRGLAYERLGDKAKAALSYGRAVSLRPKDEAARTAFARVSG